MQSPPATVRHPSESRRAFEILTRAREAFGGDAKGKLVSYLIIWKDDCDPGATIMQGKACVHVMTVTIGTVLGDGNRIQNTYPHSIGSKGISHDGVEKKISEQLLELQDVNNTRPYYVGGNNKSMQAYFEVLATLTDQPERRSSNYLGAGNGTFTARALVSANHYALKQYLPSCRKCRKMLTDRFEEGQWCLAIPQCPDCLNWDVLENNPLALAPPPRGYPTKREGDTFINIPEGRIVEIEPGILKIKPFKITYKGLQEAVDLAHDGYMNKDWSTSNVTAFLKVEGLNDEFISDIVEHAERERSLTVSNGDDLLILQKDYDRRPSAYQKCRKPALWLRPGSELCHHLDVIMHLIALGIIKTSHISVLKSLRVQSKEASFVRMMRGALAPLVKLALAWLKVGEYTGGKFQTWNAEHNLGFARIMPWFFQNISEAQREIPAASIPQEGKPQKDWTKVQNCYWLRQRGIDAEGDAATVSERVSAAMQEDPVPKVLPMPNVGPTDIERLVRTLRDMLECVMSREVTPDLILKTGYAIRIFLSAFHDIDAQLRIPTTRENEDNDDVNVGDVGNPAHGIREGGNTEREGDSTEPTTRKKKRAKKKDRPSAIESYNFACLMNIPQAMQLFGPLRELWEGSVRGEGFLRVIKDRYRGMQGNWHYNLMQSVLKERAFENVLNGPKEIESNSLDDLKSLRGNFVKYNSIAQVEHIMDEFQRDRKAPLSVLIVADGPSARIFCVAGDYDTVVEIEIQHDSEPQSKFGITYHQFDIIRDNADGGSKFLEWNRDIVSGLAHPKFGFGVLLPLLDKEDVEGARKFALVSSNWRWLTTRDSLGTLVDSNGNNN
jgi:hypothetical protein